MAQVENPGSVPAFHPDDKHLSVSILDTPLITDATVTGSLVSVTNIAQEIPYVVDNFTSAVYAVGTISKKDWTITNVVDEVMVTMTVTQPDSDYIQRYFHLTQVSATPTTVQAGLKAEIVADTAAIIEDDTSAAAVLKMKLKTANLDGGDFFITFNRFTFTENVSVAYIAPAGTPAIVGTYGVAAAVGTYKTYKVTATVLSHDGEPDGGKRGRTRRFIIFAEQTSTPGFTLFDARINEIFLQTSLDAIVQDGSNPTNVTSISADTTLGIENPTVFVDQSGDDVDVTLPDPALFKGDAVIDLIKDGAAAGNSIIIIDTGDYTLNGLSSNITVTVDKSATAYLDKANTNYRIVEHSS